MPRTLCTTCAALKRVECMYIPQTMRAAAKTVWIAPSTTQVCGVRLGSILSGRQSRPSAYLRYHVEWCCMYRMRWSRSIWRLVLGAESFPRFQISSYPIRESVWGFCPCKQTQVAAAALRAVDVDAWTLASGLSGNNQKEQISM